MNPEGSEENLSTVEGQNDRPSQRDGKGKRVSKTRPVTVYMGVLFAVVFLLLLLSFFMQQRSQQALEDLHESMNMSQDVATLQMDKQRLEFDLQQSKEDLEEAQKALDDQEKQTQAVEWLRQMEAAARTSYQSLKELVEAFEESGLADYLPTESVVEGGQSPADAYRTIYAIIY